MKIRSLIIVAAALFFAAGLHAQNKVQYHASASLSYAMPSWDKAKAGSAEGLSFGIILKERHYFEGEVIFMKHNWKDGVVGNLTLIPTLATYRYEISFDAKSDWYLQLGGSIGTAVQTWKYGLNNKDYIRLAYGAQAMAVYKLNKTFSAIGGVRILQTEVGEAKQSGNATLFSAGARITF